MKTISLNQYNSTFRIEGDEDTRSLTIASVTVNNATDNGAVLKLTVLDEKDIPIYNKLLKPEEVEEKDLIKVGERFVFYDHLSVRVEGEQPGTAFSVIVHYK
ncbi:hypothetical protein [Pontibacter cellulosilyticus]|uniref:Uncharacterized protein n=1 Tax=Pontibacter cellulosilyticus TaxID=1720253 RepID=A0A923N5L7_9BACT|nr:hypothetical protein [Pontibacter cellulosilyticus]MBC5991906.1 hypothetical protein [Pontibacter cellulosilyticus]